MQKQLNALYEAWRSEIAGASFDLAQLSPPLLLKVRSGYEDAKTRVAYIGQETLGWTWNDRPDLYPTWRYQPLGSLADFAAQNDAVEALVDGYGLFNFAKPQPENYNSPFWRQFRAVEQRPSNPSVMWLNLFRCCRTGGGPAHMRGAPKDLRDTFLAAQRALFLDELKTLDPHVCIFVTGPNYDPFLRATVADFSLHPIGGEPIRRLAKLSQDGGPLPARSYRTYHPNYLQRAGLLGYINDILGDAGI